MAKISPIVGTMSGSIAGITYSHNRGGQYARQRTIPVNPSSTKQQAVRNILATISAQWNGLTAAQRTEWQDWASLNPVIDTLGQSIQLSGQQAYVALNSRLGMAAVASNASCPTATGPDDLTTATLTLTAPGTIAVAYTPTPLAAGQRLVVWATLPAVVGRNPNRNQARLIGISAAAAASPQSLTSPYSAIAGQVSNVWVAVMDAQGLVSPGLRIRQAWV